MKSSKTLLISLAILAASLLAPFAASGIAVAQRVPPPGGTTGAPPASPGTPPPPNCTAGGSCCGKPALAVQVSFDFGCKGIGNPILDALFAVIRFLSDGVGLVVIGSVIWGGVQYAASQGNPSETAKAIERIRSSLIALLIFIFGYALLDYIIPAGVLK
jgi:hypothetical protein